MKTLIVEVTPTDVLAGKPRSTAECPIAWALRRAANLDPLDHLLVGGYESIIWRKGEQHPQLFRMSRRATDFVVKFDAGKIAPRIDRRYRFKLKEIETW